MNNISVVGIDLAKDVFQVHAEDRQGKRCFNRPMKREAFKKWLHHLPPCLVRMEACGTAHYWAREFLKQGHEVKLINPRKVKAFVERNKTDAKDAEAICDAARSHKVAGVTIKSETQQSLTSLHRARSQLVQRHTQAANHLRSQLAEHGLITKRGYRALVSLIESVLLGDVAVDKTFLFVVADCYEELKTLKKRLSVYDAEVRQVAKTNKAACKLLMMPGVGEISATAVVAKVEDFSVFNKGKDFAAWLGLTPKEHSSGGKRHLGSISKQGDRYLRTLLIHGARSMLSATLGKDRKDTAYHRWIHRLVARSGKPKAIVALANKHARMIWATMRYDRQVDLSYADRWSDAV